MAKTVKQLWRKYSDGGATDDHPPTTKDAKLRDKHISDSVPYNTRHAVDHIDEIGNQVTKLKPTNPALARSLAKRAQKQLHQAERKVGSRG